MLLDIDDGTSDGNLRFKGGVDFDADPASDTYDDFDGDGGIGDGKIDMSDFRRWRDWYLQTNHFSEDDLELDALELPKELP